MNGLLGMFEPVNVLVFIYRISVIDARAQSDLGVCHHQKCNIS